ncbi:GAF domain-containing protein [Knoellia sp. CPCC 206435]|uniref:GAF domain-containing sensor histidine kinase n=1 Tax=Knoellia terrae TaxID=3404797 RepID=UPI003B43ADCD
MSADPSQSPAPLATPTSPEGARWPLSSLDLDDLVEELRGRASSARESQERLSSLLDAVLAVSSNLELGEVLQRIVLVACELVDATYGALGVLGPSGEELVEFVTHGLTPEQREAIGPLPHGHGLLGLVIESPVPQRVRVISEHPDSYGFPPNHPPMTSFLGAPVRIRDQVFGNLYLTDKRTAPEFSEDDEAILGALAAAAGVAIENARLYDRVRVQQQWAEVIGNATQDLLAGQDQAEVLAGVATQVRDLTYAASCVVALSRESDLVLTALAGRSTLEESPEVGAGVRDAEVRAALLEPAQLVPHGERGTRALVPLALGTTRIGILVVEWAEGEQSPHLPMLTDFGSGLAVSLGAASARTERARSDLFEDRERIARDMHDNVIQRLFATGMSLQSAAPLSDPHVRAKLDTAVDELDAAIKDIRHAIFALHRVPGARPLSAEIATVCGDAAVTLGFAPELRLSGRTADIPEAVSAELLAVVREALSNVARHASASSVQVSVEVGDDVRVLVVDDGRGVPAQAVRSGLANLARRAERRGGSFGLEPGVPTGTVLSWSVPLEDRGPLGT